MDGMMMNIERIKAIGLVSGGLDSQLAVAVLKEQGPLLIGLHFYNGFAPGALRRVILGEETEEMYLDNRARELSDILGISVEVIDISCDFLDVLVSPSHGYGANVNPCIDCRILMLRRAKDVMERVGARFVFTGEVLGQRPMSQHRQAMDLVERRSGLGGLLLRPLSAKLLPPTVPENEGWVKRDDLLDIQGRSRKRQMELARKLGLREYVQPAGGCTLTDGTYTRRFRDVMQRRDRPGILRDEAVLLAVGRHFRLGPGVKIVVGRNETENRYIETHWSGSWLATTTDYPGPTVLVQGEPDVEDLRRAASVTARYSDAKHLPSVRVVLWRGDESVTREVAPITNEELEPLRI